MRWSNPQSNLGQVTFTTHFSGYASYSGLLMPLGFKTTIDFRDVDYMKMYVDNYLSMARSATWPRRQTCAPRRSRSCRRSR